MSDVVARLQAHIVNLKRDAITFDNAKWFDKNPYMKKQYHLFDSHLFASKSLALADYVDEALETLANLPDPSARHRYQHGVERVSSQIEAIIRVLRATDVWAKEQKNTPKKRYQKVVQAVTRSSHELYQELSKNQEFERRLLDMISERKNALINAKGDEASQINREILALHARLGRCRKAISAVEDKIQLAEKPR